MHARRRRANVFRYPVYMTLIDLDDCRGSTAAAPFRLEPGGADKLPRQRPLRRRRLPRGRRDVELGRPRLEVLTNLRVLGHVFNPVSFWWCRRADGELAGIVAEVNNTFGERLPYVLRTAEPDPNGRDGLETEKRLHVSPFMRMGQSYTWRCSEAGDRVERQDGRARARAPGLPRDAYRAASRVDRREPPCRPRPTTVDAAPRDLADPPAGRAPGRSSGCRSSASRPSPPARVSSPDGEADAWRHREADRLPFPRRVARRRGRAPVPGRSRPTVRRGKRPSYVVEVRRPEVLWEKLAFRTRVGFGEAYVDGDWDCDDLVGLFSLLGRNLRPRGGHPRRSPLHGLRVSTGPPERQTEGGPTTTSTPTTTSATSSTGCCSTRR